MDTTTTKLLVLTASLLLPLAGAESDLGAEGLPDLSDPILPDFDEGTQSHNDGFAAATLITDGSLPYTNTHSNVGASMEAGEPAPCGLIDKTIWYVYPTAYQQHITADTFGSDFDTVLAVYQGTSLGGLGLVGCNDDSGGGLQSRLEFDTIPGLTYYFQLGGFDGDSGTTVLRVDYGCGGNDARASACPASLRPHRTKTSTAGATVEAGEPVFTCGFNVGKTVWYSFSPQPTAAGSSVVHTFGSNYDTVVQVFAVVGGSLLHQGCNDDTVGLQSSVPFTAAPGVTYLIQVGGFDQASGNLRLEIT